jgi:hypothetical protein
MLTGPLGVINQWAITHDDTVRLHINLDNPCTAKTPKKKNIALRIHTLHLAFKVFK